MDLSELNRGQLCDLLERVLKEKEKREKHDRQAAIDQIYSLAHQFGIPLHMLMAMDEKRKMRKTTPPPGKYTATPPMRRIPGADAESGRPGSGTRSPPAAVLSSSTSPCIRSGNVNASAGRRQRVSDAVHRIIISSKGRTTWAPYNRASLVRKKWTNRRSLHCRIRRAGTSWPSCRLRKDCGKTVLVFRRTASIISSN